jgi:hypothetical protein
VTSETLCETATDANVFALPLRRWRFQGIVIGTAAVSPDLDQAFSAWR